jgi:U4/U6.U5 tri-snRNP-associated protein 3
MEYSPREAPHRPSDSPKSEIRKERSPERSNKGMEYRERSLSNGRKTDENTPDQDRGRTIERTTQPQEKTQDNGNDNGNDNDEMMKLLGFGAFDSTKNKHVEGVGKGSVKKNKKAKFRQYMNREKGFNRALSPDRKKK